MATLQELCDLDVILYTTLFHLFKNLGLAKCKARVYLSNMIYMVMKEGIRDYRELIAKTSLVCEVNSDRISAAIRYAKSRSMRDANRLYRAIVKDSERVSIREFFFCLVAFLEEYDFYCEKDHKGKSRCCYRSHIDETRLIQMEP